MKEMTSSIEKIVNEVTKDAHIGRAILEETCEVMMAGLISIYGMERFNNKILPDMLENAIKESKKADEAYAEFASMIKTNIRTTGTDGEVWD